MKNIKILIAALLILIAACNKEESELNINADDQKEVWVEGGVLHLKNQQVLDSLSIVVGTMTDEERIAWEDSLGYTSYNTLYSFVFSEYMIMAEKAIETNSDSLYFKFRELYDNLAIFPDEEIDGLPNRTIEPKVTFYSSLANEQGKLIVGNKEVEVSMPNSLKSASGDGCSKIAARRKMGVSVMLAPTSDPWIHVYSCSKKRFGGWWSYKSVFYVISNASNYVMSFKVGAGYMTNAAVHYGATKVAVWNDGVGEGNMCEFDYYE